MRAAGRRARASVAGPRRPRRPAAGRPTASPVRAADDVGAPVHAVGEVDVEVTGRAEHHRVARGRGRGRRASRGRRSPMYASTSVSRTRDPRPAASSCTSTDPSSAGASVRSTRPDSVAPGEPSSPSHARSPSGRPRGVLGWTVRVQSNSSGPCTAAPHRLELGDQTLREWDAVVLASGPRAAASCSTARPSTRAAAGQPPDHGVLLWGGVQTRIVGVRKGDDLWLCSPPRATRCRRSGRPCAAPSRTPAGRALMRTHSGLHLLSGVVFRDFGALVTGGNMEPLEARMDFNLPAGARGLPRRRRGGVRRRDRGRPGDHDDDAAPGRGLRDLPRPHPDGDEPAAATTSRSSASSTSPGSTPRRTPARTSRRPGRSAGSRS